MADEEDDRPLSPSFFEGRLLVEILSWEWGLFLGVSRRRRRERRPEGGLIHTRTIAIEGRIQAPEAHRGRAIIVLVRPFGPEIDFGRLDSLGSLHLFKSAPEPRRWEASLMLPEGDLAMFAIAVNSTSKYLHVWTSGLDVEVARIAEYSLSSTIGRKVKPWAGVE